MNEIIYLLLACIAGVLLGIFFFGGLWFTVKKGVASKVPVLWFIFSFLLRTGIVLLGFYYISNDDYKTLLACLFGFVTARIVISKFTLSNTRTKLKSQKAINHEA